MENLMNNLRQSNKDLSTATSLRLPSRPLLHGIFEDHGRSLVSSSQQRMDSNSRPKGSGTQKFKPATSTEKSQVAPSTRLMSRGSTKTTHSTHVDIELLDSESEDEMDLLSSRNKADDHSTSQTRFSPAQDDVNDGFVDKDGKLHPYAKGFKPKGSVLSTLKFKKNKGIDRTKGIFSDTATSQATAPLPASRHPFKDANSVASSSKSRCELGDTIYVSRRPTSNNDSKLAPRENRPSEPKPVAEEPMVEASRSLRPRIKKLTNQECGKQQPDRFSTSERQTSFSSVAVDDALLDFEGHQSTKQRSPPSSPKVTVRRPEVFPLSPPASPLLPKRQPEIFPHLSPLRDAKSQANGLPRYQKRHPHPFPTLSPPSKGEEVNETRGRTGFKHIKGKGKAKENQDTLFTEPEDEDDEGAAIMISAKLKSNGKGKGRGLIVDNAKDRTKRKLKRFPMSTQMLQSIDSSPTIVSPRWGKRSSEDSGDERMSKRSKKDRHMFPQSPSHSFEEGDSLLFSSAVDPRFLCPYCDSPLPGNPSSLLVELIAATRNKASSDPRPSNPLGLKAPVAVFVTVCQRHRFESQILPEAEMKGWPKTIEWPEVANRVLRMKDVLRSLIEDPGESNEGDIGQAEKVEDDWEVLFSVKKTEVKKRKGPKANCIFWNEVIQEIKEKGSRVVAGVRGQFANFEKAQPGYYGEQGSVIIHQTLYDMFPPSSLDPSLIAPLTGNEFMEKILVPEVALRLIMEDRNLKSEEGRQEAFKVLRESSSYGVFMFPEDGGEWGGRRRKAKDNELGVGDIIVMQRAMKRRKELEEEGKAEEEREKQMRSAQDREAWNKTNDRRDKEPVPTKPKPRPLGKGVMSIDSSQDELLRSRRPAEHTRSDCEDIAEVSEIETAVEISESESDSGLQIAAQNREPSPSVDKARQRRSMRATSRAISGLNIASDTDSSTRAVVGARPLTRSRSRSIARFVENCPTRTFYEDIIKTPMPRRDVGLEDNDTPKAPKLSQSKAIPPLMRARQRFNKASVVPSSPFRLNAGTPKPPLPTRIHLGQNGTSQDSQWLLEDDE